MDARIRCNFPELPVMVGFATTACFRSDAPPIGGEAVFTGKHPPKSVKCFAMIGCNHSATSGVRLTGHRPDRRPV